MAKPFKKILGGLKAFLPIAGQVLGSVHPLGGMAASMIGKALGIDNPETLARNELESQIVARIDNATPEQLLALQQVDNDFKMKMADMQYTPQRLENELAALDTQDRGSARTMAQELGTIWPQFTIVVTLTIMVGGLMWFLTHGTVPEGSRTMLNILLGSVMTAWLSSIAFFVGTTRSSARKTELMNSK